MSDVRSHHLFTPQPADLPAEWEPEDGELLPRLREALAPDPVTGLAGRRQWQAREQLAGARWFLLRNTWNWRSRGTGRAGAAEVYFTLGGIERPFNGLDEIYGLFREQLGTDEQLAAGLVGQALKLGAIEPITPEYARWLALRIMAKTGRNLYPQLLAQPA